ncbi:polysaccharide deacetylase family protein [Natronorubrum bangense]|uniref:Polysaccharide deacetylase n=1 Tax=Natronorubrum bangense JCM 10635 TaxID=1227500 RepID=L9W061_9EURY|nr:polysaccharide deacetylase family protein [Natronorubrum bangense]ELY42686.1 polysaccharide deacetylase [Natronorubrum bangense JCM 10635]
MTEEKLACVTLDLENDWYFDKEGYDHLTFEYIDDYIELIKNLGIPVTFFVVGKTIERFPDIIDKLDKELKCEFHLHSYQHDTSKSYDFREEIQRGKKAFESHFGYEPKGYRAPQGNIEPHEFKILEDEGFVFDSSVFPSYRPGIYSNLDKPLRPYRKSETNELLEIPIAATPGTRIPVCQSYLKLFGRPYRAYLKHAPLPEPLVFNTHLQDFYRTASHDQLGQPKELIMKRNLNRSIEIFNKAVGQFRSRGYSFGTMMDICERRLNTNEGTELIYNEYDTDRESTDGLSESTDVEGVRKK